jgi:hypothetical protein
MMRIFIWIVFMLSLIAFSLTINDLVNGIEYSGWELLVPIISVGLSITCFFYLFQRWFKKINQNQKIILAIFIPIIVLFFALMIASSLGARNNPFDLINTGYVWITYAIFCCIFEYKLFADKKKKDKEV